MLPRPMNFPEYYKILPVIHEWNKDPYRIKDGKMVPRGFTYRSDNNTDWMSVEHLRNWILKNKEIIGRF